MSKRADPIGRGSRYHKLFAAKAGQRAERALALFEQERPNDARPRKAIQAILAWARGARVLGMHEVRTLALASHAAARSARTDAARFAARAAGHAIATWHVPTHALAAFEYACRAQCARDRDDAER